MNDEVTWTVYCINRLKKCPKCYSWFIRLKPDFFSFWGLKEVIENRFETNSDKGIPITRHLYESHLIVSVA